MPERPPWQLWRSPAGASVETFYGAAARSMSQSWHDFIFGAFDPVGTVTVDKLRLRWRRPG